MGNPTDIGSCGDKLFTAHEQKYIGSKQSYIIHESFKVGNATVGAVVTFNGQDYYVSECQEHKSLKEAKEHGSKYLIEPAVLTLETNQWRLAW